MPWVLLIRLLSRVLAGLFIWRTATARRAAAGTPVQAAQPRSRIDTAASVQALREGAALGWRLAVIAGFGVAAAVLLAGGVTLTVLTPRWLGITMLALAVLSLVVVAVQTRQVWRLLAERRRQRRQRALRGQIS